ncbi:MAG: hypothetical protein MUC77_00575 [Chromatiaceae bacterium]|jgi:hypothetical protein|nr:hypothetical protein [Chromatiaceae bacterium]
MKPRQRPFGPRFALALVLLAALMGVPVAHAQVTDTFDTPGTTTWTVPTGVTSITVEAWGGGGGGGGRAGSSGTATARGGGGGAYARGVLTVTPGSTYTLTVGAGGAGGAAGANAGSAGGNSTFGVGPLVRAAGGSGGSAATSGAGGLGGTLADSIGDLRFRGGNANSGGGGGAGSTGEGGDTTGTTGGTGTPVGGGNGGSAPTTTNGAAPGSPYGGGGSGARRAIGGAAQAGGAGGNGGIRITYTLPSATTQVCAAPTRDGDVSTSGILNSYFPPANGTFNSSSTAIGLGTRRGAAVNFAPGDLALVIQMQCATINTTNNNDTYGRGDGTGRGYADPVGSCLAGRYEYVRAGAATTASSLDLSETPLQGVYIQDAGTTPNRRTFQVIRVPQYGTLTLSGTVRAEYWDGTTGGVVALDVADGLTWGGQTIDVSEQGFRGAGAWQWTGATDTNVPPDYRRVFDAANALRHAHKGEGIVGTPRVLHNQPDNTRVDLGTSWGGYVNGDTARGAPGTAGGGGNNRDSGRDNGGGGGGGNGGIGGYGAYGWKSGGWNNQFVPGTDFDLRGIGGAAFASPAPNRVVMGGGGGAAGSNNDGTNPQAKGGAGGGIVIVRAGSMTGTGTVNARGADGETMPENDGAGGAGAGGSVVLMAYSASGLGTVDVDVSGGQGGNSFLTGDPAHAGGGGGAGGVVIRSHAATVNFAGGANGTTNTGGDPVGGAAHGATPGGQGLDSQQADSQFLVFPGALCPPTAVVLGDVDLASVAVGDMLDGLGVADMSVEDLRALLAVWDPVAAEALGGAGREALLDALRDYLDPDGDGAVVVFRWETLEQRGTVGFYAERRADDAWMPIHAELLPALVAAPMGAQYWMADPGAAPGAEYEYRLIELEARGTAREYGPFRLQTGAD